MNYTIANLSNFVIVCMPAVAGCLVKLDIDNSSMSREEYSLLVADEMSNLSVRNPRVFSLILDSFMLNEYCKKEDSKLF